MENFKGFSAFIGLILIVFGTIIVTPEGHYDRPISMDYEEPIMDDREYHAEYVVDYPSKKAKAVGVSMIVGGIIFFLLGLNYKNLDTKKEIEDS